MKTELCVLVWREKILKTELCVLVWRENILKTELFENDDVTKMM